MPRDPQPHPELRVYGDDDVIYRAVPNSAWVDENGDPTLDNYLRRERDEAGLSVASSIAECLRRFRWPVAGIMRLNVGEVRALGFLVFENRPGHSVIADGERRIPFASENNTESFEIAEELLLISHSEEEWEQINPR